MFLTRMVFPLVAFLSLCYLAGSTQAAYVWNRGNAGDPIPTSSDNWSDPTNWTTDEGTGTAPGSTPKGSAPPTVINEPVVFPQVNSNNGLSIMDDGDHTLTAGLFMHRDRAAVTLDLDTNRLTVDGNTFFFGSWRSSPTVQNGVLQIGTVANSANMQVYSRGDSGVETATLSVRLDAVNMNNFTLANATSNINAPSQVLDMTGSTVSSTTGGAANNQLVVTNDFIVGRYFSGSTAGITPHGTLMLPSSLTHITADDFIVGENLRSTGGSGTPSAATGIINFGGGSVMNITATSSFILGHGDNANATLTNLPTTLNLNVGTSSVPASMQIAYNDRAQGSASPANNPTSGSLVSPGGNVNVYLSTLRVGQNTQAAGSATGTLDLSAATLTNFSATSMIIGVGVDATGAVYLPGGDASASVVTIGSGDSGSSGLLDLNGTLLSVDSSVTLNGPTDDAGILIARVQGVSAGLDLSDSAVLAIGSGGLLEVRFEAETVSEDIYFGLRWEGDHLAELLALQSSGALLVTNLTSYDIKFMQADGFTYIAAQAPIPEPATGFLLMVSLMLVGRNFGKRKG